MIKKLLVASLAATALAAANPAAAVQFIFTVTGAYTATFAIDKTALPTSFTSTAVTYEQVDIGSSTVAMTFYFDSRFASLNMAGGGNAPAGFFGPALFYGMPGRPRFSQGNFTLTSSLGPVYVHVKEAEGSVGPTLDPVLNADPIPNPDPKQDPAPNPDPTPTPRFDPPPPVLETVPEPASWVLMVGGLSIAGASLRRRRALSQQG